MSRPKHYSPAIDRFLVSVLYHEAKHRKQPMTAVANDLLTDALKGSEGWRIAKESGDASHRTAAPQVESDQ